MRTTGKKKKRKKRFKALFTISVQKNKHVFTAYGNYNPVNSNRLNVDVTEEVCQYMRAEIQRKARNEAKIGNIMKAAH